MALHYCQTSYFMCLFGAKSVCLQNLWRFADSINHSQRYFGAQWTRRCSRLGIWLQNHLTRSLHPARSIFYFISFDTISLSKGLKRCVMNHDEKFANRMHDIFILSLSIDKAAFCGEVQLSLFGTTNFKWDQKRHRKGWWWWYLQKEAHLQHIFNAKAIELKEHI